MFRLCDFAEPPEEMDNFSCVMTEQWRELNSTCFERLKSGAKDVVKGYHCNRTVQQDKKFFFLKILEQGEPRFALWVLFEGNLSSRSLRGNFFFWNWWQCPLSGVKNAVSACYNALKAEDEKVSTVTSVSTVEYLA